jgi:hypothetical protein
MSAAAWPPQEIVISQKVLSDSHSGRFPDRDEAGQRADHGDKHLSGARVSGVLPFLVEDPVHRGKQDNHGKDEAHDQRYQAEEEYQYAAHDLLPL